MVSNVNVLLTIGIENLISFPKHSVVEAMYFAVKKYALINVNFLSLERPRERGFGRFLQYIWGNFVWEVSIFQHLPEIVSIHVTA